VILAALQIQTKSDEPQRKPNSECQPSRSRLVRRGIRSFGWLTMKFGLVFLELPFKKFQALSPASHGKPRNIAKNAVESEPGIGTRRTFAFNGQISHLPSDSKLRLNGACHPA
jgi:hypothetical protein